MIGGKILDPSAVAAWVDGNLTMVSWLAVAPRLGLVLYVPSLAVHEVAAVRPYAVPLLDGDLLAHPQVVRGDLDPAAAAAVDKALTGAGVWDGTAGAVVHAAQARGWAVLSGDPGRLHRIDPHLDVEPI